jgi:hypothetical protein
MMGRLSHEQEQFFYSFRLDEAVSDDHPVRAIAAVLDLSWVHSELAPYYSRLGRPSISGLRWWFVCPHLNRRVRKLYLPLGGCHFWSRHAYELVLTLQRKRTGGSQHVTVKHIHQQVNVTDGGQAVVAGDEVASRARGRRRTAVGDDRK